MAVLKRSQAFRLSDGSVCRVVLAETQALGEHRFWVVSTMVVSPEGQLRINDEIKAISYDPMIAYAKGVRMFSARVQNISNCYPLVDDSDLLAEALGSTLAGRDD
jgi:hypothetical protein